LGKFIGGIKEKDRVTESLKLTLPLQNESNPFGVGCKLRAKKSGKEPERGQNIVPT